MCLTPRVLCSICTSIFFFSDFFFFLPAMHFTQKGRTACGQRVKRSQLFWPWFSYCHILRGDTPSMKPLSWIRNGYQGTRGWWILHWLCSCPGGGSSDTPSSCVVWNPIWGLVSCGHWAPAIESTWVICALWALHTFLGNKGFFMIAPCIAISMNSCTNDQT